MRSILTVIGVSVLVAMIGCGGGSRMTGSAGSGRGSATFQITWPDPNSRLIPIASQSIKIVIQEAGIGQQKVVTTTIVPRPTTGNTSVVKIDRLPVKKLTHIITAQPNADGSGVAQAEGIATVDIKKDQDVAVSVTMSSTIVLIDLNPASPYTMQTGTFAPLVATPRDFAGQQVLIVPDTLQFLSSDPSVATVTGAGLSRRITALKVGTANIIVTEPESGTFATLALTVTHPTCNVPPDGTHADAQFIGVPPFLQVNQTYTIQLKVNGFGGRSSGVTRFSLPGGNWKLDGVPVSANEVCVVQLNYYWFNDTAGTTHNLTFTMPSTWPPQGFSQCYAPILASGFVADCGAEDWRIATYRDVQ